MGFNSGLGKRPTTALWVAASAYLASLYGALWWLSFAGGGRGPLGDEIIYIAAANGLVSTGELVLDGLWPPLYAWFLAGVFSIAGRSMLALALVQTVALLAAALCLRTVATRLTGSRRAGDVSAFALLGYPPTAAFTLYAWPEVVNLSLFLGALALLVGASERPMRAMGAGVLLGFSLLTKLVLWPFVPLLALPALSRGGVKSAAALLGASALVVALLAPVLRPSTGTAAFGANIAFNVWAGLRDTSRRTFVDSVVGDEYRAYLDSGRDAEQRAAVLRSKINDHVRTTGLLSVVAGQLSKQYFRLFDHESYLTAQLPGGALAESRPGYRDVPPWLAATLSGWSSLCYAALLIAAVFGAFVPLRAQSDAAVRLWWGVLAVFILYNLAIFSGLHVVSRFRIQMLPVVLLAAARGVAWCMGEGGGEGSPGVSTTRAIVATVTTIAVLSLAFGG